MKIVYIYPHLLTVAGTERVLVDKINYFAEKENYEVMLITLEQGKMPIVFPLSAKVIHVDLDVRYYEMYRMLFILRFFKKRSLAHVFQRRFDSVMNDFQPNIVIATTYNSHVLHIINNCKLNFKRILESHIGKSFLHHNDPVNQSNIFKWINAFIGMKKIEKEATKFDVLVALNQVDACDWSRYVDTKVITNVVHLNPLGLYSNQINNRVVFVGRFSKQKGINDLFRIWKLVNQKHPDWHLDMYGDGEMRSYVCYEVHNPPHTRSVSGGASRHQ